MQTVALIVSIHAAQIDARYRILPNQFTSFILVVGISHCLLVSEMPHVTYWMFTFSHLAVGLFLPKAFGMGDVKLFAGLGLFLLDSAWYLAWIFLAYGLSLFWGLISGQKSLAFGPHIVLAWIVCSVGDYAHVSIPYSW